MKKLMLIALSTLAMSAQAAPDIKFYAGGGIAQWQLDVPTTTGTALSPSGIESPWNPDERTFTLAALELQGGAEVLPWLAVEARAGFGLERDKASTFNEIGAQEDLSVEVLDNDGNPTGEVLNEGWYRVEGADTRATPEVNYYASFYLKPQLKNDKAALYGLVGLTAYDISVTYEETPTTLTYSTETTGTGADEVTTEGYLYEYQTTRSETYDESEVTLSMGVGVAFFFDRITVNAEWKNYIQSSLSDDEEAVARAKGLSASVNYSF